MVTECQWNVGTSTAVGDWIRGGLSCAPPADSTIRGGHPPFTPEFSWTADLPGCLFDASIHNTLFVYRYWKRGNYLTASIVVTKKIAPQDR
jgi:hypothetical protein